MKNLLYIIFLLPVLAFAQTMPRANQIRNTPAGNLVSTNVQTALNELDGEKATKRFNVVTKTSNYTFVATDTLKSGWFIMNSAGSTNFTIPANATTPFYTGTSFSMRNKGAGVCTITPENGSVLFESSASVFTLSQGQYAVVVKELTNTWTILIGDDVASFMTNPMTTAADIIVGGAIGVPARLAKGTALQVLRVNSGATALEWATASGGITNSAANTELMMSNGTNAVASGLFSPSSANFDMGLDAVTAGASRTFRARGSASVIDLIFESKGASSTFFTTPNIYANGTDNFYLYGASSPTMWMGQPGTTNAYIKGYPGTSGNVNGTPVNISGGDAYTVSGNNNGGGLNLTSGAKRASGTDGLLTINPLTNYIAIPNGSSTPGSMSGTNTIAVYSQDVSSSAELFVKNEANIVTQISGQRWANLNTETSTVGNVTTGEDQLYSYTVPASTLSVDGNSLRIRIVLTYAVNANTKTTKVKFGATTFVTLTTGVPTVTTSMNIDCYIIRTGATTQKCGCIVNNTESLGISLYATAGETLSGTVALVVTGEGTATNDIVKEMAKVNFEP